MADNWDESYLVCGIRFYDMKVKIWDLFMSWKEMSLIIELLFKNNKSFLSVRFREYKINKKWIYNEEWGDVPRNKCMQRSSKINRRCYKVYRDVKI